MYKHYESSEDVFVDREEHIEWMNEALKRCKEKSVVLHLKGIGGIGKSSLLNHWVNTHEKTVRLDCEQYSEFYQRLNILAKGVVLQGVKLQRFDILWQIRQRFVEGVEPVKEEGREWAKEVVMAIPFIGSLASIGNAISAVGSKVTPKLKGRYGTAGKWLQKTLGKDHIEQLLNILWKDPRRAEFLYLEAFLEDVNNREDSDTPLLFLLDHFENVDNTKAQWKYQGQKINETQLWTIFLSNLKNCVGVLAGRRSVADSKLVNAEESELTELDKDSCFEMLELQNVTDQQLQEKIVSVSGGNPFVIDAICDMFNTSDVAVSDIEDLRGDTLAEVRLQVWRRLFKHTEGLLDIINRAGLVPFFTKEIIELITPTFTLDYWNRMIRLSFVKDQGDGTYVLHDLAEELVKAELGSRLKDLAKEVARLLMESYEATNDYTLIGISYNAEAHASLMEVCEKIIYKFSDFSWKAMFKEALVFLDAISIKSDIARAVVNAGRGWHLSYLNRIPEGEEAIHSALETLRTTTEVSEIERDRFLAYALTLAGALKTRLRRYSESEDMLLEAHNLFQKVIANPPKSMTAGRELLEAAIPLLQLGALMYSKGDFNRAQQYLTLSLEKAERWASIEHKMSKAEINREISFILWYLGYLSISTNQLSEAEEYSRRGLEISDISISVQNHLCILKTSLMLKGLLKEAREINEKETKLSKEMTSSSTEFPTYLGSLSDLFVIQYLCGDYCQATRTIEQLLLMHEDYVEKAPEVYTTGNIEYHRCHGNVLKKIGSFDEARSVYQNGIKLARNYMEKANHANDIIIRILNDYGVFLHQMGELVEGEVCFIETINICRQTLSSTSESLIGTRRLSTCLCNLGALLLETNRADDAGEILKESLNLRLKIQSEAPEVFYYHSYIASSMNNLAVFNSLIGKNKKAEKLLNKAIDIRLKHRTEETSEVFNPGYVAALCNIGMLKAQSGDFNESKEVFNKSIAMARELCKRNPEAHRKALIKVLSNMYVVASKGNPVGDLAKETLVELRQLGHKEIPDQPMWFVETSEMF